MSIGARMKVEQFDELPSGDREEVPNLEFTGERIVPGKVSEALFREHEERYVFAGQYVKGKDVLDIACGTGIGTAYLLKAGALSCKGLDIDEAAVRYAESTYPQCGFGVSEATNLRIPDSSIDVVVSFETIEHLQDQRRFLSECTRVLRPGGTFICSTPNRTVSRFWQRNRFHVHEMDIAEFSDLLRDGFEDLRFYGQLRKFLPQHAVRMLSTRLLEALGIKAQVRGLLNRLPSPVCDSREFGVNGGLHAIEPIEDSIFFQCAYLIGVGRRRSETAIKGHSRNGLLNDF